MTTLQEASTKALDALRKAMQGNLDFDVALEAFEALRTALAQQREQQPVAWYEYNQDLDAWFLAYGHNPKAKTRPLVFGDTAAPAPQAQQMEPTDDQLVKGVKAMRLFVTKNSVADFKLGYMAALAAAPAPQAQDKSDNYLSGYCTGRTDLLKEQSAQPVAQITDAAIREIADCIVSNLDGRKGVIDLDLDDDLVEEIMQEMCDTIAHGIREVK